MPNPVNWLVTLFCAMDNLLGQLRNPDSNARWALGQLADLGKLLHKAVLAVQHPKTTVLKGSAKQWGVAFLACEVFFLMTLLIVSVSQSCRLLFAMVPVITNGNFKMMGLVLPAALMLGWSMGWCTKLVINERNSLRRYWPKLSASQKLQASGVFGASYALVILASTGVMAV